MLRIMGLNWLATLFEIIDIIVILAVEHQAQVVKKDDEGNGVTFIGYTL